MKARRGQALRVRLLMWMTSAIARDYRSAAVSTRGLAGYKRTQQTNLSPALLSPSIQRPWT